MDKLEESRTPQEDIERLVALALDPRGEDI
jgi:hypothetical protein